jgi:hypothetical protein
MRSSFIDLSVIASRKQVANVILDPSSRLDYGLAELRGQNEPITPPKGAKPGGESG